MIHPSEETLNALKSLSKNQRAFDIVTEWLRECLRDSASTLVVAREPRQVHGLQQECEALGILIHYMANIDQEQIDRCELQLDGLFIAFPNTGSSTGRCYVSGSEQSVNTPQELTHDDQ